MLFSMISILLFVKGCLLRILIARVCVCVCTHAYTAKDRDTEWLVLLGLEKTSVIRPEAHPLCRPGHQSPEKRT